MQPWMYVALSVAGYMIFVATLIILRRARRCAYERARREAQSMYWKLEMENEFERTRQRW